MSRTVKAKIFEVPWGSESVCYWCKKNYKCNYYEENRETKVMFYEVTPITIRPKELMKLGSLQGCPINEFEPDKTKLPDAFRGCTIKVRA